MPGWTGSKTGMDWLEFGSDFERIRLDKVGLGLSLVDLGLDWFGVRVGLSRRDWTFDSGKLEGLEGWS